MSGVKRPGENKLNAWRVKQKLTYEALGKRVGNEMPKRLKVPHQTARRWCLPAGHRERRTPRFEYLAAIKTVTGLTADDLIADLQGQGAVS